MMLEDINHADYPPWQAKVGGTATDLGMEMLREIFNPARDISPSVPPLWVLIDPEDGHWKLFNETQVHKMMERVQAAHDIGEIVWLLKSSESHEAIAKKFGISVDTVQEIYNDYIS